MIDAAKPSQDVSVGGESTAEALVRLQRGFQNRKRAVLFAACLAVLGVWASVWLYAIDQRESAFDRARVDTSNLALAFEQNLLGVLDGISQQTSLLKRQFERDPGNFDLNRSLADLPALGARSFQVWLIDAAGDAVSANTAFAKPMNIADRAHFTHHRAADTGRLYVSSPIESRNTGKLIIQITRRLNAPDGGFAGVLVVSTTPQELSGFYDRLTAGPNCLVAIVGTDGVVRARASSEGDKTIANEVIVGAPPFLQGIEAGHYRDPQNFGGVERAIGFRVLRDYPLVALVGSATEDVLEAATSYARRAILVGATATCLIGWLSVSLLQGFDRRRRYEHALRANAERYLDFARSASEWQWETDAEGRFCWFSDGAQSVTGIDPALMIGRRREEFALDLTEPAWVKYLAAVNRRLPFRDFIAHRNRLDGTRWFVRSSGVPIFDADGAFLGYRGVTADVTREQEDAERLRQTEARLRGIAENLPGVVFQSWQAADGGGFKYLYLSERVQDYFGCAPEDGCADPENVHKAVHPDDRAIIARRMSSPPPLDNRNKPQVYRVIVNGQTRWMRGNSRGRQLPDGAVLSDGVVIDVTEAVEREQQVHVARQQAESANNARAAFLAHVSHELRTPLNAILGYSEVIRDRLFGADDPRYPDYAAHIHSSGAHLLAIINDLLDLSRVDAGHFELDEDAPPLSALLSDSIALTRSQAASRGVKIEPAISVVGTIDCDRRRLTQVLVNVLSNAAKFSPIGGTVSVEATLTDDGALRLVVTDQGPGMSEEELSHAFEPFRRGDATLRAASEGTGLGLPISQRFMQLHGGAIEISNAPEGGARVALLLPRSRCRDMSRVLVDRASAEARSFLADA